MSYLPHRESQPSINSCLNLFNAENVDVSVKNGFHEQFFPLQPLSDNIHFQIFSNDDYFIDLESTFIDLRLIVSKEDKTFPTLQEKIQYENCVLHNLFKQVSVYLNSTLVSTSNNLSNYASYIQFMLMTPKNYKKIRGASVGYHYSADTDDTVDALCTVTTKEYHLVGKLNHEIFNINQWLPPGVKVDIKLTLAPSNFIVRKLDPTSPEVKVSLSSAILHVRKQQVMSSVALAVEKLRSSGNNIKLLVPHTAINQRHIPIGSRNYTDSSFINGEIPSKLAFALVKSSSVIGNWTASPHKFELFKMTSLVCKVNGVPLYNLSFDGSYKTLYELTMQALDRDSQLFENGITEAMFTNSHGIIVLDLSGTQDMSVLKTGTVRLELTFEDALVESITLISLSQFESYWEITPDGSALIDLAP